MSTAYRSRILACIEAISALKAENQEIELRSRWQNIVKLGEQWMYRWKSKGWKKSGNQTIQELGYIQQLYALCEEHRISWLYIPDGNDEHGIQTAKKLAQEALNRINVGEKSLRSERVRAFPLDKIL